MPARSTACSRWPILSDWDDHACAELGHLNLSNRRVQTRMPGGVGGDVSDNRSPPIPIFLWGHRGTAPCPVNLLDTADF